MSKRNKQPSYRVRLSNETLNSYGTWVVTAGIDLPDFENNPILLYMHRRGEVIGYVEDLRVEGEDLTGTLVFDEASELSSRCKKQWEVGSLRMVSVGLDIIETSADKKYLKEGQLFPTITKSRLFELSVVDVGANKDALVLRKDGKSITMGTAGDNPLPLLSAFEEETNQPNNNMNQEQLALSLGLPKDATEEQINEKIAELSAAAEENTRLLQERENLMNASITAAVEDAVKQKLFSEEKKDHFIELGKKVGLEALKSTFDAMSPQARLTEIIGHQGGAPTTTTEYKKLSEVPGDEIDNLKEKNPTLYARLFKAEYGMSVEEAETK